MIAPGAVLYGEARDRFDSGTMSGISLKNVQILDSFYIIFCFEQQRNAAVSSVTGILLPVPQFLDFVLRASIRINV